LTYAGRSFWPFPIDLRPGPPGHASLLVRSRLPFSRSALPAHNNGSGAPFGEGGAMHYLIDGYNLLHHVGLLSGRVGPTKLDKARRALLGHLSGRLGDEAVNATVGFAALRARPGADRGPED